jgi:hypothetical protein
MINMFQIFKCAQLSVRIGCHNVITCLELNVVVRYSISILWPVVINKVMRFSQI